MFTSVLVSSNNQGFLRSGVLQSGVPTIRGSYNQGFLQSGALTIRGSYDQGSYNQGFLGSGVLTIWGSNQRVLHDESVMLILIVKSCDQGCVLIANSHIQCVSSARMLKLTLRDHIHIKPVL